MFFFTLTFQRHHLPLQDVLSFSGLLDSSDFSTVIVLALEITLQFAFLANVKSSFFFLVFIDVSQGFYFIDSPDNIFTISELCVLFFRLSLELSIEDGLDYFLLRPKRMYTVFYQYSQQLLPYMMHTFYLDTCNCMHYDSIEPFTTVDSDLH